MTSPSNVFINNKYVFSVKKTKKCALLYIFYNTLEQKSLIFWQNSHFQRIIFHKIHIFQISQLTKFTFSIHHFWQNSHFSKPHFWQNSQFQSIIFPKIHIFQISQLTKFTFFKHHFLWNFWINWLLPQCVQVQKFCWDVSLKLCHFLIVWSKKGLKIDTKPLSRTSPKYLCVLKIDWRHLGLKATRIIKTPLARKMCLQRIFPSMHAWWSREL